MINYRLRGVVFMVITAWIFNFSICAQQRRPMTVEDILKVQEVGQIVPSPSGDLIAVVIQRDRTDNAVYVQKGSYFNRDRSDIWVVSVDGQGLRKITNGAVDGSTHWNPKWSPDGRKLLFLSSPEGNNVKLHLWDHSTESLKVVSDRLVDTFARVPDGGDSPRNTALWLSDSRLVVPVFNSELTSAPIRSGVFTQHKAPEEWNKTKYGKEPAVSVVRSGPDAENNYQAPLGELLLIDLLSGKEETVLNGTFSNLLISPDKRHLAVEMNTDFFTPQKDKKLQFGSQWHTQLGLVDLELKQATWFEEARDLGIRPQESYNYWSPGGDWLSYMVKSETENGNDLLYLQSTGEKKVKHRVPLSNVSKVSWLSDSHLMVQAQTASTNRLDWWHINVNAKSIKPKNVTADLPIVPRSLIPQGDSKSAIGLVSGALLQIDVKGKITNLSKGLDFPISAILSSAHGDQKSKEEATFIIASVSSGRSTIYHIDTRGDNIRVKKIERPSKPMTFQAYVPRHQAVVFKTIESDGTYLWHSSTQGGSPTKSVTLNEHLALVDEGEKRLIDYQSLDGKLLKALVLLPPGYQETRKYPVIAWLYPGTIVRNFNAWSNVFSKNSTEADAQLLAAQGYIVILPSMPLAPPGQEDFYLDMPKGVVPAVKKLIALGMADPSKLSIMGSSWGGYAVNSIITQTTLFKAGVSMHGYVNMLSNWGTFDPRYRYMNNPFADLPAGMVLMEDKSNRTELPPFKDFDHHRRNSPIYNVSRVETPLLLIHSDQDYIPMEQGEEMFTALYRQGKTATMIRYWGEGHGIESPANIKDKWYRVFKWLDQQLND